MVEQVTPRGEYYTLTTLADAVAGLAFGGALEGLLVGQAIAVIVETVADLGGDDARLVDALGAQTAERAGQVPVRQVSGSSPSQGRPSSGEASST